jgi:hypothetical protein
MVVPKKKIDRRDPVTAIRLSLELRAAIDAWAAGQGAADPVRSFD